MARLLLIFRYVDNSSFGIVLFFLSTFIVALLELISVGGVPAFFTVLLTPDVVIRYLTRYLPQIPAASVSHFTLVATVGGALSAFLLFKGLVALAISKYQARTMAIYQSNLSSKLLEQYLKWPYEKHLVKNSAELIRNTVSIPVTIVGSILGGVNTLVTEMLVVILMAGGLLIYHPIITALMLIILGAVLGLFFLLLKNGLARIGRRSNMAAAKTMQWLNQSLGGIKEIKTANCNQYFHDRYLQHFANYSKDIYKSQYISQAPRLFLDFIAVSGMIGLAVALMMTESVSKILPTIALFGAVFLRLIPSANRIWSALAAMRANINSAEIYVDDMSETSSESLLSPSIAGIKFESLIELRDLSYLYPGSKELALDQINLQIRVNTTVGFSGRSGAGKSTLMDILLGLHRATAGDVLIDGLSMWDILPEWRAGIGYVPQQIFILDDSIRRNIALGDRDQLIEDARVISALEKASLYSLVQAMPEGLDTVLGEGGARLSGGQRQRIGIARALYRNPKILFLDEATSALDNETERAITDTLQQLHGTMTIIIVAHHAEIMRLCDEIFMLEKGRLLATGSSAELESFAIHFK